MTDLLRLFDILKEKLKGFVKGSNFFLFSEKVNFDPDKRHEGQITEDTFWVIVGHKMAEIKEEGLTSSNHGTYWWGEEGNGMLLITLYCFLEKKRYTISRSVIEKSLVVDPFYYTEGDDILAQIDNLYECVAIGEQSDHKIYGKSFAHIQSSGTGKTKAMYFSFKKEKHLFGLCRRTEYADASVLVEQLLVESLKPKFRSKAFMDTLVICWLNCIFKVMLDYLNLDNQQWLKVIMPDYSKTNENVEAEFRVKISAYFPPIEIPGAGIDDLQSTAKTLVNQLRSVGQKKLIIFLDEARGLVTPYDEHNSNLLVSIRRIMHEYLLSLPIVVVFADTHSLISNFAPTFHYFTASMRKAFHDFPISYPIYWLFQKDVFSADYLNSALENIDLNAIDQLRVNHNGFWWLGRSLWHSMTSYENAVELAIDRLGIQIQKVDDPNALPPIYLSWIFSRISMHICPAIAVSSEFVASLYGICCMISHDRSQMTVQYIEEPVVAIAASVNGYDSEYPLKTLSEWVAGGLVDTGEVGEIICQILLLSALDSARIFKSKKHPRTALMALENLTVPLDSAISRLCSSDVFTGLVSRMFPKSSHVTCTQFIRCDEVLSRDIVQNAYARSCGILCKTNNLGFDIILPVATPTSNGESKVQSTKFTKGSTLKATTPNTSKKTVTTKMITCSATKEYHALGSIGRCSVSASFGLVVVESKNQQKSLLSFNELIRQYAKSLASLLISFYDGNSFPYFCFVVFDLAGGADFKPRSALFDCSKQNGRIDFLGALRKELVGVFFDGDKGMKTLVIDGQAVSKTDLESIIDSVIIERLARIDSSSLCFDGNAGYHHESCRNLPGLVQIRTLDDLKQEVFGKVANYQMVRSILQSGSRSLEKRFAASMKTNPRPLTALQVEKVKSTCIGMSKPFLGARKLVQKDSLSS